MGQKKDPSAMIKEARRAEELAVAKALIVREAAIAAAQTFRHYAQIHRDKGDEAKAARNEDEAVKLTLAIMATANLPDFRALSNQFEEECRALRSRVAELEDSVRIEKSGRDAVVAGRDSSRRVTAKLLAERDTARAEVARLTAEVEAMQGARDDMRAALSEALSVAVDCQQRWSRGHADRVARATLVLDGAGGPVYPVERAAEMEARLLSIVEVARPFENWRGDDDDDDAQLSALCDAVAQAIIALRARKVGG